MLRERRKNQTITENVIKTYSGCQFFEIALGRVCTYIVRRENKYNRECTLVFFFSYSFFFLLFFYFVLSTL